MRAHLELTVRDYFAASQLSGIMSGAESMGGLSDKDRREMFDEVASLVYEMADAMLRAREVKP